MNREPAKEREIQRLQQVVYDNANCMNYDPAIFFPDTRIVGPGAYRLAKSICGKCIVKDDCLRLAIISDETDSVWGGLTPSERKNLKKHKNAK